MKFKKIMSVLLSFIMVAAVFAGIGPIKVKADTANTQGQRINGMLTAPKTRNHINPDDPWDWNVNPGFYINGVNEVSATCDVDGNGNVTLTGNGGNADSWVQIELGQAGSNWRYREDYDYLVIRYKSTAETKNHIYFWTDLGYWGDGHIYWAYAYNDTSNTWKTHTIRIGDLNDAITYICALRFVVPRGGQVTIGGIFLMKEEDYNLSYKYDGTSSNASIMDSTFASGVGFSKVVQNGKTYLKMYTYDYSDPHLDVSFDDVQTINSEHMNFNFSYNIVNLVDDPDHDGKKLCIKYDTGSKLGAFYLYDGSNFSSEHAAAFYITGTNPVTDGLRKFGLSFIPFSGKSSFKGFKLPIPRDNLGYGMLIDKDTIEFTSATGDVKVYDGTQPNGRTCSITESQNVSYNNDDDGNLVLKTCDYGDPWVVVGLDDLQKTDAIKSVTIKYKLDGDIPANYHASEQYYMGGKPLELHINRFYFKESSDTYFAVSGKSAEAKITRTDNDGTWHYRTIAMSELSGIINNFNAIRIPLPEDLINCALIIESIRFNTETSIQNTPCGDDTASAVTSSSSIPENMEWTVSGTDRFDINVLKNVADYDIPLNADSSYNWSEIYAAHIGWPITGFVKSSSLVGENVIELAGPRNAINLGNITSVGEDTNVMYAWGWATSCTSTITDQNFEYEGSADSDTTTKCFGYCYPGEEPVFNSTRVLNADDSATIKDKAPNDNVESVRFNIAAPLRAGENVELYYVAKLDDGTIVKLLRVVYTYNATPSLNSTGIIGIQLDNETVLAFPPALTSSSIATDPMIMDKGDHTVVIQNLSAKIKGTVPFSGITGFKYQVDNGSLNNVGMIDDRSRHFEQGDISGTCDRVGAENISVSIEERSLAPGLHTIHIYAEAKGTAGGNTTYDVPIADIPIRIVGIGGVSATLDSGSLMSFKFKSNSTAFTDSTSLSVSFTKDETSFGESTEGFAGTDDDDGKTIFEIGGINPLEMTKKIKASLSCTIDDTTYTDTFQTSVRFYSSTLINDSEQTPLTKRLVTDLLKYGAAAQIYNKEPADSENLATHGVTLTNASDSTPALTNDYTPLPNQDNNGAKWRSVGLRLEDSILIRYGIVFKDTVNKEDVSITFTYTSSTGDNKTVTKHFSDLKVEPDRYSCYLALPVYDMQVPVTGIIKEGDTVISEPIVYSIQTYAKTQIDANTANNDRAELANLLDMMMRYGKSAYDYKFYTPAE